MPKCVNSMLDLRRKCHKSHVQEDPRAHYWIRGAIGLIEVRKEIGWIVFEWMTPCKPLNAHFDVHCVDHEEKKCLFLNMLFLRREKMSFSKHALLANWLMRTEWASYGAILPPSESDGGGAKSTLTLLLLRPMREDCSITSLLRWKLHKSWREEMSFSKHALLANWLMRTP